MLSHHILQYAPIKILGEMNRAMKMGGILILANFKPDLSMQWAEFVANFKGAFRYGWREAWVIFKPFKAVAELFLFFGRFAKKARAIIKFAKDIDEGVKTGAMPENPNLEQLRLYAQYYGFDILEVDATYHEGMAYRLVLKKVAEAPEEDFAAAA